MQDTVTKHNTNISYSESNEQLLFNKYFDAEVDCFFRLFSVSYIKLEIAMLLILELPNNRTK